MAEIPVSVFRGPVCKAYNRNDAAFAENRDAEEAEQWSVAFRIAFLQGMGSGKIIYDDGLALPDHFAPDAGFFELVICLRVGDRAFSHNIL